MRRLLCLVALVLLQGAAPVRAEVPPEIEAPAPASGRGTTDSAELVAADVYARVELLQANVERLRKFMGQPEARPSPLKVSSAGAIEVYSIARNLERRANRLAFEQVRVVRPESPPPPASPRPGDIYAVVNSAFEAVLLTARELGVEPDLQEKAARLSVEPADVFNRTIAAASEIDVLLEVRTSPSDVFQLVTGAVHTAATLHVLIPEAPPFPEEPPFEPDKSPIDVFLRLQRCVDLVERIGSAKRMEMLDVEVIEARLERVRPADVGDLASLLAEEIRDLHRGFPEARAPVPAYYPGRRFPSHVYQRAGLLEQLLVDLADAYAPPAQGGG